MPDAGAVSWCGARMQAGVGRCLGSPEYMGTHLLIMVLVQEFHHPPGVAGLELEPKLPARGVMHGQQCAAF